jgi:hypothetical protein
MHHSPKAAKQCRLSEDYGHRDTLAANWGDPNDPERTPVGRLHCCVISFVIQSFGQFTLRARGSRSEISAWKHAPRDGATKTPISLLLEGETAGTALDAFSSGRSYARIEPTRDSRSGIPLERPRRQRWSRR